jgi:molecular chaperone DnaK (HSP70)
MYLGIDFGTSFSQISTLYLNQPFLLLRPGEYGIPSEFYYDKDNGILVGEDALDAGQGTAATNLVSEVKMKLGQSFTLDGRTFKSRKIVGEIFKVLVGRALQVARTRAIDPEIQGVVITVPAEFTLQERELIREAAENCLSKMKLPITAIIKEPVAAALSYYHTEFNPDRNILIYDLGGGTCDIALVHSDCQLTEHYDVVASAMVRRGGRDWDQALADYIARIIEGRTGISVKGNAGIEEKIRRVAIEVKHKLSDRYTDKATARIEVNGRIVSVPITRKVFDEVTSGLLHETMQCLADIYHQYSSQYPVQEIICVGGSSNMLQIEEGIRSRFPACNVRVYQPEHAVVNGAAIYAELLKGAQSSVDVSSKPKVIDRRPFSYGVETYADFETDPNYCIISNIILKGQPLPAQGSKCFYPLENNQYSARFPLYESSCELSRFPSTDSDKRYIGIVELILPPHCTIDTELTCQIQFNDTGLLEVTASEPSGRHVEAQFKLKKL